MSDSTSSLPRYVVDASVATKWLLRDEPDTDLADLLLEDSREGRIDLLAPAQLRYEVSSAVRNAVRARRLTPADGRGAIADFLSWSVRTIDDDALLQAGFDQALRFRCSFYDGVYVALAEIADCSLVFADLRLRNALGSQFPRGIWLSDYVPFG